MYSDDENEVGRDNAANAPVPVETALSPLDSAEIKPLDSDAISVRSENLPEKPPAPLSAKTEAEVGEPRRVTEIHSDDIGDENMHGGYASVEGKKHYDNKLVWIVVIIMSVISIAVGICSSLLTGYFMRRGNKTPTIDTDGIQQNITAVVNARKPVIVEIIGGNGSVRGSGVIMKYENSKAYILTNAHMLGSYALQVRFDGEDLAADQVNIVGYSTLYDVAVIAVSYDGNPYVLGEENFSRTEEYSEGDYVVAIGNGMGLGIASYDGIIARKSELLTYGSKVVPVMRTTAAINAGMSGGALFDMNGHFIGLNTYRMSSTDESGSGDPANDVEDTGFVMPVSIVYPLYNQIIEHGTGGELGGLPPLSFHKSSTSAIGDIVFGAGFGFTTEYRLGKLTVTGLDYVTPPSGISEGDVIVAVGSQSIDADICKTAGELLRYSKLKSSGTKLSLTLSRDGSNVNKTFEGFYRDVD